MSASFGPLELALSTHEQLVAAALEELAAARKFLAASRSDYLIEHGWKPDGGWFLAPSGEYGPPWGKAGHCRILLKPEHAVRRERRHQQERSK